MYSGGVKDVLRRSRCTQEELKIYSRGVEDLIRGGGNVLRRGERCTQEEWKMYSSGVEDVQRRRRCMQKECQMPLVVVGSKRYIQKEWKINLVALLM